MVGYSGGARNADRPKHAFKVLGAILNILC